MGSCQMERGADIRMPRIFAYNVRAPCQKQMTNDPKRILCTNRNQYLIRLARIPRLGSVRERI